MDLSFPLDGYGATFLISVVKFDNYSYRFYNPRIKTPNAVSLYVKEVHILLNRADPPGATTYRAVDLTFNSNATPTILSTASLILEMDKGPGKDEISIGLATFTKADGPGMAAQRFNTARQIIVTNCGSCHTNTQQPYFAAATTEEDLLNMTWNGAKIVAAGSANDSRIYQVLLNGARPTMPPSASSVTRSSLALSLKSWIDQIPTR
jgi:hypothetical protein